MPFKSKTEAAAYVAGMFDGEGTVTTHPKVRRLSVANTDTDLLDAVGEGLDMLGIRWSISARCSPSRPAHWKQGYDLYIYGQDNLRRFLEVVPFRCVAKREKLEAIIATFRWRYRRPEAIPFDEMRELYENGKSYREIAEHFDCSNGTVWRWMSLSDIPKRSHSEATRLGWDYRRRDDAVSV